LLTVNAPCDFPIIAGEGTVRSSGPYGKQTRETSAVGILLQKSQNAVHYLSEKNETKGHHPSM
jgi:hypothetical protein